MLKFLLCLKVKQDHTEVNNILNDINLHENLLIKYLITYVKVNIFNFSRLTFHQCWSNQISYRFRFQQLISINFCKWHLVVLSALPITCPFHDFFSRNMLTESSVSYFIYFEINLTLLPMEFQITLPISQFFHCQGLLN